MIISSRVQLRDAAYRNRHVRQGIPGEVLNPPGDSDQHPAPGGLPARGPVTSKAAAVVRATIETESDVFVMPSLPLVECANAGGAPATRAREADRQAQYNIICSFGAR